MACGDYDRTRALMDGRVKPEGIELTYLPMSPEEVFWRMLQYLEFEISEMSMSNYLTERCKAEPRFIAIPVFPSRMFRHSCIFINTDSGIERPEDLKGKRVGIPEYSMTATVWLRGILQHEYGVAPEDMEWHIGGLEEPGREERIEIKLPESLKVQLIPQNATLNDLLESGEIDALITARAPSCFWKGSPKVRRLWPDYKSVEIEYFKRTGIFPIMHTVVIRRDIYEKHPWVAQSMYKAFCEAKRLCQSMMNFTAALTYMLPWSVAEYEFTTQLMGDDFWPYGVEANRKTVDTLAQYSYEQGLSSRRLTVDELFAPNTFKEYKV